MRSLKYMPSSLDTSLPLTLLFHLVKPNVGKQITKNWFAQAETHYMDECVFHQSKFRAIYVIPRYEFHKRWIFSHHWWDWG